MSDTYTAARAKIPLRSLQSANFRNRKMALGLDGFFSSVVATDSSWLLFSFDDARDPSATSLELPSELGASAARLCCLVPS